jgi:phosphate starvation-inducible membrane PsiE
MIDVTVLRRMVDVTVCVRVPVTVAIATLRRMIIYISVRRRLSISVALIASARLIIIAGLIICARADVCRKINIDV